ncbi:spinster family MFS transporter [Cupriavidus sp. YAF13]|uniref:spinster family MFS transporter n=1 Tax=Cupriavidus sp. YAF13 TaxID=3233075 RepID=UPI003F8E5BAC
MQDLAGVPARTASGPRTYYRYWFLTLLILVYASSFVDRIFISVVAQKIKAEMSLSDVQLGILGGLAFSILYATLSIPVARLAERRNRVTLISVSIALWSAMTALCGTAGNFWHLLLYRLGVGIGEAGCTPAAHSLIADQFPPERRATAFSLYALGPPLGVIAGAIGGSWLAQRLGWREAFYVVGLPGLILGGLAWLTLKEPQRGASDPDHANAQQVPSLREVLSVLMRSRAFVQFLLGTVICAFAQYAINLFMPVYLARVFGMDMVQAGLAFGLIVGIGGLAGNALGGFAADAAGRYDPRWYAWVPACGTLLGFPLAAIAFLQQDWHVAVPLLLLCTLMLNVWNGPTFAVVHGLVSPRMRATASAIVFLTMNLIGQGFGPPTIGMLSDLFASHIFAAGNFQAMCHAGQSGGHAVAAWQGPAAAACAQASAQGLRYAMLTMSMIFAWASLHYFFASRQLGRRAAGC